MLKTVSPGSDGLHQPHLREARSAFVCGRHAIEGALLVAMPVQRGPAPRHRCARAL